VYVCLFLFVLVTNLYDIINQKPLIRSVIRIYFINDCYRYPQLAGIYRGTLAVYQFFPYNLYYNYFTRNSLFAAVTRSIFVLVLVFGIQMVVSQTRNVNISSRCQYSNRSHTRARTSTKIPCQPNWHGTAALP
jgi:hypothetical protein